MRLEALPLKRVRELLRETIAHAGPDSSAVHALERELVRRGNRRSNRGDRRRLLQIPGAAFRVGAKEVRQ